MGSPHYRALEVTCIQSQNHSFEGYRITTWFSWITGIINRNSGYFQKCGEIFDFWPFFGGQISVKWPFISSWGDGELTLPELLDGAAKSREFQNRLRVMDIDQATWADCEQNISQNKMSTYVNICQHMSTPDETKLGIRFQSWNLSVISVIYVATWKPELLAALNPWLFN